MFEHAYGTRENVAETDVTKSGDKGKGMLATASRVLSVVGDNLPIPGGGLLKLAAWGLGAAANAKTAG